MTKADDDEMYVWEYGGQPFGRTAEIRDQWVANWGAEVISAQDLLNNHVDVGIPTPHYTRVPSVILRNWPTVYGLTAADRLVLLVLMSWADPKTGKLKRGGRQLAREAAVSRNTAREAIRKLVKLGWVSVVDEDWDRYNPRTTYQLHLAVIVRECNWARDNAARILKEMGGGSAIDP